MASPRFDPSWSHLPAGTEIPELRTSTSRTYSNGNGTFTADITPPLGVGAESGDSARPTSTGWISYFNDYHGHEFYSRHTPELHYRRGNSHDVAFAKFDLSSIPDSSTILNAQFRCYQYEVITTPLQTECTYPDVDPGAADDATVFTRVRDGPVLTQTQWDSTGWVTYGLSSQGVALLQGRLQRDWVTLGVSPATGEGSSFGIYGDHGQAYLRVVYLRPDEPDVQALNAELLTYPIVAGRSDTAVLTIVNEGRHASATFWAYSSLGLTRESTLVQPVAVGETSAVRVALPWLTARDTMLDYRLWASERTDGIRYNDSAQLQCWSFPTSTYLAEGFDDPEFPPGGWVVADSDGGTHCWMRQSGPSGSHSGNGFASCAGESTGTNDDWLVSGSVCPDAGYPDSVGFFIRNDVPMITYTLEVWALSGKRAPAMLLSLSLGDTVYSRHSVSLDTFDGDTIEVAFRHRSWDDWRGLYLDDIWFSGAPAPDPSDPRRDAVQRTSTPLPSLSLAPNPALGRFVRATCYGADGTASRLSLHDVQGRIVATFSVPSGTTRLDLRGFTAGVYFATLEDVTLLISRKLIISR